MAVKTNKKNGITVKGTSKTDSITNYGNKVTINAGKGNDTVNNEGGSNLSIVGGAGNDFIYNTYNPAEHRGYYGTGGENVTIDAGEGDDTICNERDNVTINAGAGNDSVYLSEYSSGENVLVKYTGGNDTILGLNENSTLQIAEGTMSSVVRNVSGNYFLTVGKNEILLTNGDDPFDYDGYGMYIYNLNIVDAKGKNINFTVKDMNDFNYDDDTTFKGTSGRDALFNSGSNVLINAGAGNDYIYNGQWEDDDWNDDDYPGSNVTIDGGKGDDTIENYGNNSSINAGKGNDYIDNWGYKVSILGGDGNDSIDNWSYKVSISGGKGNDTIDNNGGNVSISGGKGNDFITLSRPYSIGNNIFVYSSGDGNDTIQTFSENDSIKIADDSKFTASISDNDVIFKIGKGSITLTNAAQTSKKITLVNSENKVISANTYSSDGIADGKSITLNADETGTFNGKSFTNVNGSKVVAGIEIIGGSKASTLKGGAGKDSITCGKGADKLYGGAGNDILKGGKGADSLWGGAGNDKLYGGSGNDNFIYKPGEGTDTIFDYSSGDMLTILKTNGKAGGTFTDSSFKNNKLTLEISGGGTVIFDGVSKGDNININGTIHTISGNKLK